MYKGMRGGNGAGGFTRRPTTIYRGERMAKGERFPAEWRTFTDPKTGVEVTQLTDLDQPPPPAETSFLFASTNPRREEVYFWHGRTLAALDLKTLEERLLYEAPRGFLTNITN